MEIVCMLLGTIALGILGPVACALMARWADRDAYWRGEPRDR